ncbi:hypothetical protein D3C86_2001610 [compost metagenome]
MTHQRLRSIELVRHTERLNRDRLVDFLLHRLLRLYYARAFSSRLTRVLGRQFLTTLLLHPEWFMRVIRHVQFSSELKIIELTDHLLTR